MERGADGAMTGYAFPEMLIDVVRLSKEARRDAAHDLFDAHLPLIRYEQQPGAGLAVRKYVLQKRGVIASSAQRKPGSSITPRPRPKWIICCRGSRGSTGAPICSRNPARRADSMAESRRSASRIDHSAAARQRCTRRTREIEVFMMVRHYEIDFNSGALVFPGGSVDKGDNEIIARPELYSGARGSMPPI